MEKLLRMRTRTRVPVRGSAIRRIWKEGERECTHEGGGVRVLVNFEGNHECGANKHHFTKEWDVYVNTNICVDDSIADQCVESNKHVFKRLAVVRGFG
jgi:hypothetical protein